MEEATNRIGDLVVLRENLSSLKRKLGWVEELYFGGDGLIRIVSEPRAVI